VSEAEREALTEALAEAERGDFATEEMISETAKRFHK
jgi:predicted transcriptional regulator